MTRLGTATAQAETLATCAFAGGRTKTEAGPAVNDGGLVWGAATRTGLLTLPKGCITCRATFH